MCEKCFPRNKDWRRCKCKCEFFGKQMQFSLNWDLPSISLVSLIIAQVSTRQERWTSKSRKQYYEERITGKASVFLNKEHYLNWESGEGKEGSTRDKHAQDWKLFASSFFLWQGLSLWPQINSNVSGSMRTFFLWARNITRILLYWFPTQNYDRESLTLKRWSDSTIAFSPHHPKKGFRRLSNIYRTRLGLRVHIRTRRKWTRASGRGRS